MGNCHLGLVVAALSGWTVYHCPPPPAGSCRLGLARLTCRVMGVAEGKAGGGVPATGAHGMGMPGIREVNENIPPSVKNFWSIFFDCHIMSAYALLTLKPVSDFMAIWCIFLSG